MRQINLRVGDTLQAVALRELGDPFAWRTLVTLNGLKPPYLIASLHEADRLPGTRLWGDPLLVPAVALNPSIAFGEDALGVDVAVVRGSLVVQNGDLATIAGTDNLGQAITHRVMTDYASYLPHQDYGCEIHRLLGLGNNAITALLGAAMVRRAILRDPRAVDVAAAGGVDGDRLRVTAQVRAVDTETVTDANLIFQMPVY